MSVQPIFFVGSGRCGTATMTKVFGSYPQVEAHHEYMVNVIQPLAVKWYLGLLTVGQLIPDINNVYRSAVWYCQKPIWLNACNKASWMIERIYYIFPNTVKFIHLVRDGRKVCSSFFNKLGNECYSNRNYESFVEWLAHPNDKPLPPPEKKYWWPVPNKEDIFAKFDKYNQFQRICWHWKEVNANIERQFLIIPPDRKLTIRLEDLVADEGLFIKLCQFVGVPHRPELWESLKRPHNVSEPIDYPLTDEQLTQFNEICGNVMAKYGYLGTAEYKMEYHPNE